VHPNNDAAWRTLLEEWDDLLRNILPTEIAERLKASSDTIAEDFHNASVLFADVVDFTGTMGPRDPIARTIQNSPSAIAIL
jgi:class 3 adenylate cyclase